MFKNYCKIALRNLFRNKVYSFINISGLAIGMAVALLIGLWIWNEMTFDHFHSRHARLGRIYDSQIENGQIHTYGSVDVPLEEELRTKYAGDFKHMAMAGGFEPHLITAADKKLQATGIGCEHELPGMLTLHMVRGNIDALQDPSSTLIAASLARSLFGDADPMGRTIQVDDKFQLTIAGIYEDLPSNAVFHNASYFVPWERHVDTHIWIRNVANRWGENFVALYVELNDHADFEKVSARIRHIPSDHIPNSKDQLFVHPMDKWHLYNEFKDGRASGGNIQFVWLFGTIAAFVLLLACINFMNLSTARSEKRALEVGIRKTMGSLRSHLIGQFLGESLITAFMSLLLSILLIQLLLPVFNQLSAKSLTLPWQEPVFWIAALAFTVITGLISGSYPAFYLSRFQPVKVLKGAIRSGRRASLPRQILVVVQFTVSVVLIIGTLVVYNQINFAKARPLGYDKDGLVTVNLLNNPALKPRFNALRHDLLASGVVVDVAGGSGSPIRTWMTRGGYSWAGKDPNSNPFFGHAAITHDYGNTARWQIIEGRDFTRTLSTDSGAIILNESAVKLAGLTHPVGQSISFDNPYPHPIIGVVKDMVTDSPYDPATPTIFFIDYGWINYITLRLNTHVPANQAMTTVQNIFKQYDPQGLVSFGFLDQNLDLKFASEERIGSIATFFTILAVFISCLGLFGLASFIAEQRTREIGIRKVLGATIYNVWSTLSKDFVILVLIACAIAIPVSVYMLHGWLQRFPYRTTVSWQLCTGAVLGAMALTLITVSYQTLRAAVANPAKSLRTE